MWRQDLHFRAELTTSNWKYWLDFHGHLQPRRKRHQFVCKSNVVNPKAVFKTGKLWHNLARDQDNQLSPHLYTEARGVLPSISDGGRGARRKISSTQMKHKQRWKTFLWVFAFLLTWRFVCYSTPIFKSDLKWTLKKMTRLYTQKLQGSGNEIRGLILKFRESPSLLYGSPPARCCSYNPDSCSNIWVAEVPQLIA